MKSLVVVLPLLVLYCHLRVSLHPLELLGHIEVCSPLPEVLEGLLGVAEQPHVDEDGADHGACPALAPLAVEGHHPLPLTAA